MANYTQKDVDAYIEKITQLQAELEKERGATDHLAKQWIDETECDHPEDWSDCGCHFQDAYDQIVKEARLRQRERK